MSGEGSGAKQKAGASGTARSRVQKGSGLRCGQGATRVDQAHLNQLKQPRAPLVQLSELRGGAASEAGGCMGGRLRAAWELGAAVSGVTRSAADGGSHLEHERPRLCAGQPLEEVDLGAEGVAALRQRRGAAMLQAPCRA